MKPRRFIYFLELFLEFRLLFLATMIYLKTKYVAALYCINGADVLLRATDVDNKKFYIPNDIWIAATNAETEETELQHIMSIGEKETI